MSKEADFGKDSACFGLPSLEDCYDFLMHAPIGIFTSTPGGRFLAVNWTLARMYGYGTPQEMVQAITDIAQQMYADPADRNEFARLLEEQDELVNHECRLLRRDGSVFWASRNVRTIRDQQKKVLYYHGFVIDVSQRKQAEEALRQSEQRYRELFNSIRDSILLTNTARNIIDCNQAFTEQFGYTQQEIKGQKTASVYANEKEYQTMGQKLQKYIDQPNFIYVIHYKKKSGEVFPGETNVFYLRDSSGQVIGFIGIIKDISQRMRAEQEKARLEVQLNQAQKMEAIGRLAGGVAHDFNNLLTTILGNAELALLDLKQNEPFYNILTEIKGAGDKASALTRQLLAFSRRQVMQPEILDLNELLQDMSRMLRRIIGEDIELEILPASGLGLVEIDPGQLEQVIMNLAVNARDAMPGGGKLTIEIADADLDRIYSESHGRVVRPGPYVLLAVSDTGQGMPPEIQAQIFDPFFTTKDKGKGTGLGLSTVYGIVKQSSGYIWVYSEPEAGTTFKIYLPRVEKHSGHEQPPKEQEQDHSGTETILVVEDDQAVRNIAAYSLRIYGYRVLTASDGAQALARVQEEKDQIHLVLTDVVMPQIGGLEMVQELKKLQPGLKVLYMSGYTTNSIVHHGILDQGVDFLQKPFTPNSLASKVREVLDS